MRSPWVAVAGLPLLAGPQDPDESVQRMMATPVVSATRVLQTWDWAPALVRVVDKEQIRRRRYRTLLDLLDDLPDFKVDRAGDYDTYHAVTTRGIRGQTRLVILMDGVRISGPTNEPVPLLENFPLHHAFRVEVMVGPGSALFGADAFAGVVNIITRGPEEGRSGELELEGGDARSGRASFFHHEPLGDDGSLRILAFQSRDPQPDPMAAWPDLWRAGRDAHGAGTFTDLNGQPVTPATPVDPDLSQVVEARGALLGVRLQGFEAFLFHRESAFPSSAANRPEFSIYNDGVTLGFRQTTLSASYRWEDGTWAHLSTLTGQRFALDSGSNYRNAITRYEPGYEYMASTTLRWEQELTWHSERTTLHGGWFFEGQDAIAKTPDLQEPVTGQGPIRGKLLGTDLDADLTSLREGLFGAYVQGQSRIGDQLELTLGARWERHQRYGNTLHPRLGVVWKPQPQATWKLLYGSAYLAPSPFDAYNTYGTFQADGSGGYTSAFWHLPNPGLRPMRLVTGELGHYRGLGAWLVGGTAFMTEARHLFGVAPDATSTQIYGGRYKGYPVTFIEVPVNQGALRLRGMTLQAERVKEWDLQRRLKLAAYFSWVEGRLDATGTGAWSEAPYLSPFVGRLQADLDWGPWSFSPRWLFVGRQRLLPMEAGDPGHRESLPGYHRLDCSAGLRLARGLQAYARVENALDRRYLGVPPQSEINSLEFHGTPQPARRWSLGVELRW
ncbi:MAG TPA: TonB-dependent receptor [Holophagaceae bacterium]|nr:TonB-dependent receptor [Holophagaceae bacterium]